MADVLKERGFFWWFNEPGRPSSSKETSIPALLTVADDGQITLETDGALCFDDEHADWFKPRVFPSSERIVGLLASNGKYVLLEGLERTDFSFRDESLQQQKFSAQLCRHRDTLFPDIYSQRNFDELRIELNGFEDWLELDSIVVGYGYPENEETHVQVSYKEQAFSYPTLGGKISIESITTGGHIPGLGSHPTRDAQFKQHYYLIFRPDIPGDVSSLRNTYTRLEELLALFIGSYNRLPWPILVSKEEPCDSWDVVYFYRGAPSAPINRYSIWVSFPRIKDTFGNLFRDWQTGSDVYGAGYYLYVSSLRNPHLYAEHRFVNLVWCVEALHRKWLTEPETSERVVGERERVQRILDLLPEQNEDRKWLKQKLSNAHEPSLRIRILECLNKLPFTFDELQLRNFARACADRRNDISHTGGPREGTDYDSFHTEVSYLAEALDHLFHLLMLHQIGVDSAVLFKIISNSLVSERIKTALTNANLSIQSPVA